MLWTFHSVLNAVFFHQSAGAKLVRKGEKEKDTLCI